MNELEAGWYEKFYSDNALIVDADRYRWLRKAGAWESERAISDMTPQEFDAAVDKAMREDGFCGGVRKEGPP